MPPRDPAFDPATVEAFFAAVLVNDVVDDVPVLPAAVPIFQTAERLAAYHALCRQLWREGLDRAVLARVTAAGLTGRQPQPSDLAGLKHVRAKFKQLRYAHAMCDRGQRTLPLLNRTTVTMGQLQDSFRHARTGPAWGRSAQLRLLTVPPLLARMAREADAIDPIDPAAFATRMDSDLDRLGALAAGGPVSGHAFHAARKVVSRHNSLWTALSVLHPGPVHHRLFRWMSAINGAMGALHDELVERRAADPASYRACFVLPADVAERLDALVRLPRTRQADPA